MLNPASVNVTEYVPGRRSVIRYTPDESDTADRTFSINAGLAASTVTPGSTPPEVSRTTPVIEPVETLCARTVAGSSRSAPKVSDDGNSQSSHFLHLHSSQRKARHAQAHRPEPRECWRVRNPSLHGRNGVQERAVAHGTNAATAALLGTARRGRCERRHRCLAADRVRFRHGSHADVPMA